MLAYAKGIPFIVTAKLANYSADAPNTAMLVAKNSSLHGPKDRLGKTIGIPMTYPPRRTLAS